MFAEIWAVLNGLSWPAAFTLVGTLVGGVAIFLSWLGGQITSWRANGRVYEGLEEDIRGLKRDVVELEKDLSGLRDDMRSVDAKIVRISELMIEYFSSRTGRS